MYIECIGTEFGTLQIRWHIRSVEIPDVEITSVGCSCNLHRSVVYTEVCLPDYSHLDVLNNDVTSLSPVLSDHGPYIFVYENHENWWLELCLHGFAASPITFISHERKQVDIQFIKNASCENRDPCVFPGHIWHQLTFRGAVSIGHSICKAYVIGEHV